MAGPSPTTLSAFVPAEQTSLVPTDVWNHYGRLTASQRRCVVDEAWRDVIAPAVQLLCGEPVYVHHDA